MPRKRRGERRADINITSVCRVVVVVAVVEPSLFAFRFPSCLSGRREREGGSFGIPKPRTNSNSRFFQCEKSSNLILEMRKKSRRKKERERGSRGAHGMHGTGPLLYLPG